MEQSEPFQAVELDLVLLSRLFFCVIRNIYLYVLQMTEKGPR